MTTPNSPWSHLGISKSRWTDQREEMQRIIEAWKKADPLDEDALNQLEALKWTAREAFDAQDFWAFDQALCGAAALTALYLQRHSPRHDPLSEYWVEAAESVGRWRAKHCPEAGEMAA